jgi:beta-glucanase (GH16 family)
MLAKFTLAAALSSLLLSTSVDAWSLQSTLSGSTFFNAFSFFTSADPTHGFVKFVSQSTAQSTGLTYLQNNQVIIKADNTTANASGGRNSVRIVSNASYNSGLFILDLVHMPTGCGTWPAFWMVGPNWPNSGEIDVSKFGVSLVVVIFMSWLLILLLVIRLLKVSTCKAPMP